MGVLTTGTEPPSAHKFLSMYELFWTLRNKKYLGICLHLQRLIGSFVLDIFRRVNIEKYHIIISFLIYKQLF